MAKRNQSAARRAPETEPAPRVEAVQAPADPGPGCAVAFDDVDHDFFHKGEAGIVEPPVYLPYDSVLVPLMGVLLLVGLSCLVML